MKWLQDAVASRPRDDCWIWPFGKSEGYGIIDKPGNRVRKFWAHRLAVEMDGRQIPDGMDARHTCDVRACCNPDHIVPGTRSQNMLDAVYRARVGAQKLTPANVLAIRASGETDAILGARYGVAAQYVSAIRRRVVWTHLPDSAV